MRTLIAAALLLSSTAAIAGNNAGYEMGGRYARFDPVVSQYNQSGELFRIEGHCQSACTLFLGIRNVCIGPGASLDGPPAHPARIRLKISAARIWTSLTGNMADGSAGALSGALSRNLETIVEPLYRIRVEGCRPDLSI